VSIFFRLCIQALKMDVTPMTLPTEVVTHPLVLLSTVDHYTRLNAGVVAGKRVVGVLLGTSLKGVVDITNSFAIPFEEDAKTPHIFYLDHNFLENMCGMFRKVNARERIVGWYSTGPKIKPNDLSIHQIFRRYCTHPVYCIIEVEPKDLGIPTTSYIAKEETEDESSEPKLTFQHVPSSIGALEAEEIGVEHLLRDVTDTTVSTLSTQVKDKVAALSGLYTRLEEIKTYLNQVVDGILPINHNIMYKIQGILNIEPLLHHQRSQKEMAIATNDNMMAMYISALVRAVIALHDLINNKQELQKKKELKEKEKKEKEKREKDKKEKEDAEKAEKDKKAKEDVKDEKAEEQPKDGKPKDMDTS
jgi:26S proteasome regulatory subunit N8